MRGALVLVHAPQFLMMVIVSERNSDFAGEHDESGTQSKPRAIMNRAAAPQICSYPR